MNESEERKLADLAVEAAVWIESGPEKAESLCRDLRKYAAGSLAHL